MKLFVKLFKQYGSFQEKQYSTFFGASKSSRPSSYHHQIIIISYEDKQNVSLIMLLSKIDKKIQWIWNFSFNVNVYIPAESDRKSVGAMWSFTSFLDYVV